MSIPQESLSIHAQYCQSLLLNDKFNELHAIIKGMIATPGPYLKNGALTGLLDEEEKTLQVLLRSEKFNPSFENNVFFKRAVEYERTEFVMNLINHPNFNCDGIDLVSLLRNRLEIAKLLLSNGKINNLLNPSLIPFLVKNHFELIELLLKNPHIDAMCAGCILRFIRNNPLDIGHVKLLLKNPKLSSNLISNALWGACLNGCTETVKLILKDSRTDPTYNNYSSISHACREGHVEIAKLLLADSRVNQTVYDNKCICIACEKGHVEIVKLLLADSRVNPSADNNYALKIAIKNKHLEIISLLLQDERLDTSDMIDFDLIKLILPRVNKDMYRKMFELVETYPILYFFSHPKCPHCSNFEPTWNKLIQDPDVAENLPTKRVDVSLQENENIVSRYNVKLFPTIILQTTSKYTKFNGSRTVESLKQFVSLSMYPKTFEDDVVKTFVSKTFEEKLDELVKTMEENNISKIDNGKKTYSVVLKK